MSDQHHHKEKEDFSIRPMPLYGMLVCGIIITIAGIYLYSTDHIAGGLTHPVRGHGYTKVVLNGVSTIVLGLGICIFPAYELIRNAFTKHKD
jgi:hypothetical protein